LDEHAECLFSITAKKIHQTPVYTGMTALGVCLPNPAIESATESSGQGGRLQGILDIGYRYDARDGQYKLLDVNPRLGATFRIVCRHNGMDVTRAQLPSFHRTASARQQHLHRKEMDPGRCRLSCRPFQYYRDGVLSLRQWLRELSRTEGVRLVCGRRHHAVSSHVFVILHATLRKIFRKTGRSSDWRRRARLQYAAGIG
jgi:hypothetical protein